MKNSILVLGYIKLPFFILLIFILSTTLIADTAKVDYNKDVRPILSENCFHCHGPDTKNQKGDLRLDTTAGISKKVDGTLAIVPGKPDQSAAIHRILSNDPDDIMPPPEANKHLTKKEIDILKQWIKQGAKFETHWSFIKPKKDTPLKNKLQNWSKNTIDRFILNHLENNKLTPTIEAKPSMLYRRLSLDLTGLPPKPEALKDFIKATKKQPEQAYQQAIENLINSPHYGERMALPWLDAARYADSNGFQQDGDRDQWIWRDWVVDAFNQNMPFDQFTIEQLAGDLLPNPTQKQIIATGFNRNHMINGEGGAIAEEQRINYVFDRVETTSTVWLGLTMACSQCHDHKYDPLSQKEYYEFFAYFNNIPETGRVDKRSRKSDKDGYNHSMQRSKPWISLPTPELTKQLKLQSAKIKELRLKLDTQYDSVQEAAFKWDHEIDYNEKNNKGKYGSDLSSALKTKVEKRNKTHKSRVVYAFLAHGTHENEEWKTLAKKFIKTKKAYESSEASIPLVMVMEELPKDKTRKSFLLDRGNYQAPKGQVYPNTPKSLPPLPANAPKNRLTLAKWLVSPEHPLTARVTINRLWQQFFGKGLVKTSEDFGAQGSYPSHPKLLDWLAKEFMDSGWDIKHMVKLILKSATYRQSSKISPELLQKDPANVFLARSPRYRLPSTLIRDQALALSGLIQTQLGGEPVYPYQPKKIWSDFSFNKIKYPEKKTPDQLHRRSIYTFFRRTVGPTNLFDQSARQVCYVKPSRTNTPLQALTLLNDITFVEASKFLGKRLLTEAGDQDQKLKFGFQLCTGREPSAFEMQTLRETYQLSKDHFSEHPDDAKNLLSIGYKTLDERLNRIDHAAYTQVAQVLLNLDEVINRQ